MHKRKIRFKIWRVHGQFGFRRLHFYQPRVRAETGLQAVRFPQEWERTFGYLSHATTDAFGALPGGFRARAITSAGSNAERTGYVDGPLRLPRWVETLVQLG